MSNVVSMGRTCEFLVTRAARHRRAGRYDEAMALLSKAKDQAGVREDVELEMAKIYEEIDCEEEAARCYLRIVRLGGEHRAQALFHLALGSAQRADLKRASSYYQQFLSIRSPKGISADMSELLGRQLKEALEQGKASGRKARAKQLEERAVRRLQEGKAGAGKRTMLHAIALCPNAQRYTLAACCCLLQGKAEDAVGYAEKAHRMSPGRVQTLCVLADAYAAAGNGRRARKALYLAALRARATEDMFAVILESGKYGEDAITLSLTQTILKREPFHTKAMLLRACALVNEGRLQEASRLFGRLCGLLPEDTVCEAYFRMTREGRRPGEHLGLGLEVTHEEGVARATELLEMLYADPKEVADDPVKLRSACRLGAWAIRSQMAGPQVTTVALVLLSELNTDMARETLLDCLMDPAVSDAVKASVLQVLTAKEGFRPYHVDFGGQLVRLAAGGVSSQPMRGSEANARVVQRVSDALAPEFTDAPRVLLPLYLEYIKRYEQPRGTKESACAAALEYIYHEHSGHLVGMKRIAARWGVSQRLSGVFVRRFQDIISRIRESKNTAEDSYELH